MTESKGLVGKVLCWTCVQESVGSGILDPILESVTCERCGCSSIAGRNIAFRVRVVREPKAPAARRGRNRSNSSDV